MARASARRANNNQFAREEDTGANNGCGHGPSVLVLMQPGTDPGAGMECRSNRGVWRSSEAPVRAVSKSSPWCGTGSGRGRTDLAAEASQAQARPE